MLDKIVTTATEIDKYYMKRALSYAQKAYDRGEIPIGALVVSPQGMVLASAYNKAEESHSQSRHAEIRAIERAGKKLEDWRLEGCTLYVTLEPCLMCMGLICLSRIKRLVYGAQSPLFGYHIDKETMPRLYTKHIKGITGGVLEEESKRLLEQFFKNTRKKGEQF